MPGRGGWYEDKGDERGDDVSCLHIYFRVMDLNRLSVKGN